MNIQQTIKNGVKRVLAAQGYVLTKVPPSQRNTMEGAFKALFEKQYAFKTVIDVGASNGSWSASLMNYFPDCNYLLIEAQPVHEPDLQQFCHQHPNCQYVLAAAGDQLGQIYFDATDPFSGQASYTPYASNNTIVPVTTIDHELQSRQLAAPYLIKLDTHGFEVPIFRGALEALKHTEIIIVEAYNFKIAPDCLLFFEMCEYLRGFGFRCVDLVDLMHRPYDDALWQMDLVFARDNRPEFAYSGYEAVD